MVGLRGEHAVALRQVGAVGERGLVVARLEVQAPHVPLLGAHDDAQHAARAPHPQRALGAVVREAVQRGGGPGGWGGDAAGHLAVEAGEGEDARGAEQQQVELAQREGERLGRAGRRVAAIRLCTGLRAGVRQHGVLVRHRVARRLRAEQQAAVADARRAQPAEGGGGAVGAAIEAQAAPRHLARRLRRHLDAHAPGRVALLGEERLEARAAHELVVARRRRRHHVQPPLLRRRPASTGGRSAGRSAAAARPSGRGEELGLEP